MIATLPMYDRPETQAANDRFWNLIRAHLDDAPEQLSRDDLHWHHPDLLLSQTCSLPYRTGLQDHVTIVATPVHNLPCPAGTYYSVIVVRQDDERERLTDFADARLAINSPISQSGWAAIDEEAQAAGIRFGTIHETGSHRESARRVARGEADICSLDAVSWEMMKKWDAAADHLRVIAETVPTPALPYVTGLHQDSIQLQEALVTAVHELSPEDQDTLCLLDVTHIPAHLYLSLPIPPSPSTVPFADAETE